MVRPPGHHGGVSKGGHWQSVYSTRPSTEVSWFQGDPAVSTRLVAQAGALSELRVVDVGAGTSTLVDALLGRGCRDVTVLDLSVAALSEVRARLGIRAAAVAFEAVDVLGWTPAGSYDVWHDRAVFHFLVDPRDQARYVQVATAAVRPGGHMVIGAFADDGPTHCSGLPTCRFTADELAQQFAPAFTVVTRAREEHVTPGGVMQPFTWLLLQRADA